jgi:Ring hydroxylating beta subunit
MPPARPGDLSGRPALTSRSGDLGGDDEDAVMDKDERVTRFLLKQEIEDFLYHEADLLDERRYEDWLALVAEDVRYWMPMRPQCQSRRSRAGVHPRRPRHQLVRRGQGYPDPAGAANPDRDRILRAAVKNDFPVNVLFWDRMLAGGPKGRTH